MINGLLLVVFFIMLLLMLMIRIRLRDIGIIGTPTVSKFWFYLAKAAFFISIIFAFLQALGVNLSIYELPKFIQLASNALIVFGATIFSIAIISLGTNIRFGLPEERTQLIANGIYAFSRNPIYLGLMIIMIGSCFYAFNPLNWFLTAISIIVHHSIILSEEKFLEKRFGDEWNEYQSKVRRYF